MSKIQIDPHMLYTGTEDIGEALGVDQRTVTDLVDKWGLPAFQLTDKTPKPGKTYVPGVPFRITGSKLLEWLDSLGGRIGG